jgi:hypothetical protein
MPLLLRNVRQNRWLKDPARAWLDRNEVPADPLGDLRTQENALSVWEVADDHSNLERVVRAIVLGSTSGIANTGYVIFDAALLESIGIASRPEPGVSPDADANKWPRDLINLTGSQLVALTRVILEHGESGQVLKKRLLQLIQEGIEKKELPEKCRSKLPARGAES